MLGVGSKMRYGPAAMGGTRQAQAVRALVMLTATLASLWAGTLVAPNAGTPAERATPSLVQLGIEPGALRPMSTAVASPGELRGPHLRPIPLLAGLLATLLLGGAWWRRIRRLGSGLRRIWRLDWPAQLPTRAPPYLSA